MTKIHCSCGYAGEDADEIGDHLRDAFTPADDIGTDGRTHGEIAADCVAPGILASGQGTRKLACFCGFVANRPEFDDHLLARFTTVDQVGVDGARHVPEPEHAS
jgi:hypothetical protein